MRRYVFDNRELEKFDEKHEKADEILNFIKGKTFDSVDTEATRVCPICNIPMVKMGANGAVVIDVCNVCGAKFLDHNELETIRETITDDKKTDEELQAIYNTMEIENDREMYGIIVLFLRKFLPSTKGRQISENIVRKII